MGDPRKQKRLYSKPATRWHKDRIEEEKELLREFGLKNKSEIWKTRAQLGKFRLQAKRLNRLTSDQAELEKKQLLTKLVGLGLIQPAAGISEILNLQTKDILERRLQTQLVRKKLARSMKQARQFITHQHIVIDGRKTTFPSYLVKTAEEDNLTFVENSNLSDVEHPERTMKPEPVDVVSTVEESEDKEVEK